MIGEDSLFVSICHVVPFLCVYVVTTNPSIWGFLIYFSPPLWLNKSPPFCWWNLHHNNEALSVIVTLPTVCVCVNGREAVAQWVSALNLVRWTLNQGIASFSPTAVSMSLCPWALHPKLLLWGLSTVLNVCKSLWIKASNKWHVI